MLLKTELASLGRNQGCPGLYNKSLQTGMALKELTSRVLETGSLKSTSIHRHHPSFPVYRWL